MKIFTYPNTLAGGQRAFHYLKTLGVEWTKDPLDPEITHLWHYNYANRVDECPTPLKVLQKELDVPIINENLLNIKKDFLDEKFKEAFGYSVMVDPTKHRGMVYVSSTQNAIHLHKLIQCPIQEWQVDRKVRPSNQGEPHYRIYKRWIDTRISPDTIRDFRIVIMGGRVVYLMEKHLDYTCVSHPKKGKKFEVYGHNTMDKFFSKEEQNQIREWIDLMGADFGEADILRDNSSGLMYIIDKNPIPAGAALVHLGDEVIKYLAEIFKAKHLC